MDQLPHEYLKCNDYLKEQISITFFVRDRIQFVKLSIRDVDEMLRKQYLSYFRN